MQIQCLIVGKVNHIQENHSTVVQGDPVVDPLLPSVAGGSSGSVTAESAAIISSTLGVASVSPAIAPDIFCVKLQAVKLPTASRIKTNPFFHCRISFQSIPDIAVFKKEANKPLAKLPGISGYNDRYCNESAPEKEHSG